MTKTKEWDKTTFFQRIWLIVLAPCVVAAGCYLIMRFVITGAKLLINL
jgi:hypothetical protein